MSTPIWLNDPTIILKHNKLNEIWPMSNMTINEKVNAITRFVIILTFLGYMLTLSLKILFIGIITLVVIVILYITQSYINSKKNIKEQFVNIKEITKKLIAPALLPGVYPQFTDQKIYKSHEQDLSKPTPQNPMMNLLLPEIYLDPKRKGAAPTFFPIVENEVNNAVKKNVANFFGDKNIINKLFSDANKYDDGLVFDRSMRQWYTMPNTRVPNDQDGFAKFAYGSMLSGKEGNKVALARQHGGAYNYRMS